MKTKLTTALLAAAALASLAAAVHAAGGQTFS